QRDHVMTEMGAARPDLAAVHDPAAVDFLRCRAKRREVGAGIRLAHADSEIALAPGDPRQDLLALLLGSEAEQQGAALPIRAPVHRAGCTCGQQSLRPDMAIKCGALVPAVLFRPHHAEPSARTELAAELGRHACGPAIGY